MLASRSNTSKRHLYEWPLGEIEETVMTLATTSLIKTQDRRHLYAWRTNSSVVHCHTCHRKFHSLGNLANHKQLYQH